MGLQLILTSQDKNNKQPKCQEAKLQLILEPIPEGITTGLIPMVDTLIPTRVPPETLPAPIMTPVQVIPFIHQKVEGIVPTPIRTLALLLLPPPTQKSNWSSTAEQKNPTNPADNRKQFFWQQYLPNLDGN